MPGGRDEEVFGVVFHVVLQDGQDYFYGKIVLLLLLLLLVEGGLFLLFLQEVVLLLLSLVFTLEFFLLEH